MGTIEKYKNIPIQKQMLSCFDSEQLRYAVKGSNFELQQLNKGDFRADLFSLPLDKGILDKAYYGSAMLNEGTLSSEFMTFGCLFGSKTPGKMNGVEFNNNDIILCDEDAAMTYYSTDDSLWSTFQFKREELHRLGITCSISAQKLYHIRSKKNDSISLDLKNTLSYLEMLDSQENPYLNAELLHNHILTLYARTLEDENFFDEIKNTESRILAKRIYQYINDHSDYTLQMINLTALVGKTERTVERIFKKHFGITPYKYLKLHRLNLIRKQLIAQRNLDVKKSITEIAVNSGFMQMGYFGYEYKKMFGETASETLRRSS